MCTSSSGPVRLESTGRAWSMQDVFGVVHKVASSLYTVIIYGESGTGRS